MSTFLKGLIEKSKCLDLEGMCISKGKQCWILFIDALVLDSGGNLIDSLSIAVRAALLTTRIPKIEVSTLESGDVEIEITDNYDALPLRNIPLCVSLAKIGSECVVDPSLEEETVMGSRVTIAVNSLGEVCSIQKVGTSSDLQPSELIQMVKIATKISIRLFKEMDNVLKNNEGSTKVGFFA
jgi:exosome complex component RRP42